jgi:hypothetical protein
MPREIALMADLRASGKGAVVGLTATLPVIVFFLVAIVNPAGVGFRTAPVGLLAGIAGFGAAAGALTGLVAARARQRRLLAVLGVELALLVVAVSGYTTLVIAEGASGPSSLVAVGILWLAIAMVTVPVVAPGLVVGALALERWTRRGSA